MAIDTRKVILAAVEAALDDVMSAAKPEPRRGQSRMPAGRAVLLGAGVMTAARFATSGRGRQLVESVQGRLAEYVEDGASSRG
jgi:hypothetical protein